MKGVMNNDKMTKITPPPPPNNLCHFCPVGFPSTLIGMTPCAQYDTVEMMVCDFSSWIIQAIVACALSFWVTIFKGNLAR